jgi:hypothetical protein
MNNLDKLIWLEEIRNLKARYFRLQDNKLWDEYRELFLDDSVFDVSAASRDPSGTGSATLEAAVREPIVGRDAIVDYVSKGLNDRVRSFHEGFMPEIEILSEASARAIWPMEDRVWFPDGKLSQMHGFGCYHETYTRRDTRWYIQTLRIVRMKLELVERAA